MNTTTGQLRVGAVYRAFMTETYISEDFKAEVVNERGKIVAMFYGSEDEARAEAQRYVDAYNEANA
jgi:hypothetical protein